MSDTIKKDFFKWVKTLDMGLLSEIDKKLLNILIEYFDMLAPLRTSQGARSKKIVELIQQHKYAITTDLPELDIENNAIEEDIGRITKFTVGPFRGFSSKTVFDFDNNYVFIYGPNGSGKSSFCEGLEYALLGDVWEAEAKRIPLDQYIKNGITKAVEQPVAYYKTADRTEKIIHPNQELYQFAFIEKNRIDGFARITAVTPEKQKDRIAILFGLDAFSSFVDGFTDNFGNYLSVETPLKNKFSSVSQTNDEKNSRLQEIEKKLSENAEKLSSLIKNLDDKSVVDKNTLQSFLIGDDGNSGIINKLQEKKVFVIPDDIRIDIFENHTSSIKTLQISIEELKSYMAKYLSLSSNIKYKELFNAISTIEEASETDKRVCPACKTPISETIVDPFIYAKNELIKLKELSDLQERIPIKSRDISQQTKIVKQNIIQINDISAKLGEKFIFSNLVEITYIDIQSISTWLSILSNEVETIINEFSDDKATSLKLLCEQHNTDLSIKRGQQNNINSEIQRYNKYYEDLIQISSTEKILNDERQNIIVAIKQFEVENEETLKQIKNEQETVEVNKKYIEAYDKIIKSLKKYRDSLPALLSAGLADKAKEFYNIINSDDPDFDKISELILPSKSGEKMYIRFVDSNEKSDALYILSEGHIKILGLSILLSKAIAKNLKVIIFDDIVNAVDDNHRDGIARLLIEHSDMRNKQLILTCHGDIFINKLEHRLGASRAGKEVIKYTFHPISTLTRSIEVSKNNAKAGHYLLQATESLNNNNLKDAAAKCRRAVESVSHTLWKKLGEKLNIKLQVLMRTPTSEPELATVVDTLTREIGKINEDTGLCKSLKELKENYIWSLLNKGTHEQEDLPEFDKADLENLIVLITNIENSVTSLKLNIIMNEIVKQEKENNRDSRTS
jgi:DNA repair exonuclease SbcCD ATPase subunit